MKKGGCIGTAEGGSSVAETRQKAVPKTPCRSPYVTGGLLRALSHSANSYGVHPGNTPEHHCRGVLYPFNTASGVRNAGPWDPWLPWVDSRLCAQRGHSARCAPVCAALRSKSENFQDFGNPRSLDAHRLVEWSVWSDSFPKNCFFFATVTGAMAEPLCSTACCLLGGAWP